MNQRTVASAFFKVVGAIYMAIYCAVAIAQVTPPMEYEKYVGKARSIQPLGDSPFGEQISLYDGSLSFTQTDFELPGIGPTIKVVRSFQLREDLKTNDTTGIGFYDWELEVPRIRTITADHLGGIYSVLDWQVDGALYSGNRYKRCSLFGPPPQLIYEGDSYAPRWDPDEWWSGYHVVDMNGGSQSLLRQSYGSPLVTTGNWTVSCLPTTANGEPGEAFLATSPDGTRYWLNYLVYVRATTLDKAIVRWGEQLTAQKQRGRPAGPTFANESLPLGRRYGAMLVTRIEDRFGNSLTYNYQAGKLTSISASDGRHVSITYNGGGAIGSIRVDNVDTTPRAWSYEYNNYALTAVVNPDASRWTYDLRQLASAPTTTEAQAISCSELGPSRATAPISGSITTPSGLTGSFTLIPRKHGRSYVPKQCWEGDPYIPDSGFALIPNSWHAYSLSTRNVAGPGVPSQTWQYTYSPPNQSWEQDCNGQATCPTTIWTEITNPRGERERHIFSNRFDHSETLELSTEVYPQGVASPVRVIYNSYAITAANAPWPYPYPELLGTSTQVRDNPYVNSSWSPLSKRVIQQDGTSFTWQANTFDTRARVLSTTEFSSLGHTRTTGTTYHDNFSKWVLGQVSSNLVSGIQVSSTDYDPITALPIRSYGPGSPQAPGLLQQSLTYYADGTWKTITDGRNNTTSFSNWKRGIPQLIQYPATSEAPSGATQSAHVNDNGWLDWVIGETDAKTCYAYDAMGRVKTITYPSEATAGACDTLETTWGKTTQDFLQIAQEEHGLAAGHWRSSRGTGNGYAYVYYDAYWRPILEEQFDLNNLNGTLSQVVKRYDADGRMAFQSYPQRGVDKYWDVTQGTRTSYDALGRVTRVEQDSELGVLPTTIEYLSGFKRKTTNPRNASTVESFQVYDAPGYDLPIQIDAPENTRTTIVRDALGKPKDITRGSGN